MFKKYILSVLITSGLSCKDGVDYYDVPLTSANNYYHAVIEIPAGTNKKFEYRRDSNTFEIDIKDGKERIIEFLPYPGNYGYIPSTYSDPKKQGDGDALDVLVLSESLATGTIVEIIPVAMLKLIDDGEIDYKIIAIPADQKSQVVSVKSLKELDDSFPEVKAIIELWFLNYNKHDEASIEGWGNEVEAVEEIIKNKKQQ
ncbi:MAG: inorganic diphosphatase [Bacteroidota bacterium]